MTTTEDIKEKLYLRLNQEGIISKSTDRLYDKYIEEACFEIAAEFYFKDLLFTVYGQTDNDGIYTIDKPIIPYMTFLYEVENVDHSGQRITPVSYDLFRRWKSGWRSSLQGGYFYYGTRRRYTVLPRNGEDTTKLQLMELKSSLPISVTCYPIRPSVADFPSFFEPYITAKAMYLLSIDLKQGSGDRFFQKIEQRLKEIKRRVKKQALTFEVRAPADSSILNNKSMEWLMTDGNDIGFFKNL